MYEGLICANTSMFYRLVRIFLVVALCNSQVSFLVEQSTDPKNNNGNKSANPYYLSNNTLQWDQARQNCKNGGEYDLSIIELEDEIAYITNNNFIDFERGSNFWVNAKWSVGKKAFVWRTATRNLVGDFVQQLWSGDSPYNETEFTSEFALVLTYTIEEEIGFNAHPDNLLKRYLCEKPKKLP